MGLCVVLRYYLTTNSLSLSLSLSLSFSLFFLFTTGEIVLRVVFCHSWRCSLLLSFSMCFFSFCVSGQPLLFLLKVGLKHVLRAGTISQAIKISIWCRHDTTHSCERQTEAQGVRFSFSTRQRKSKCKMR